MNPGVPSTAGLADGLRAAFYNAPVPSGWTLTLVESSETASILMRTIWDFCNWVNIRSSTPALAQRFTRVYTVCQLPKRLGRPRYLQPYSAT